MELIKIEDKPPFPNLIAIRILIRPNYQKVWKSLIKLFKFIIIQNYLVIYYNIYKILVLAVGFKYFLLIWIFI